MVNLEEKFTPTLLIGMPIFNGELFLKDSIDSLIKQSFKDWELLISDNDSTDNTAIICQEYTKKDNRIKYHKQNENIGAAKNFSFLLEKAQSKYFMWAACDDIWDEHYLSKTIVLLNNGNVDFVFSNIELIDNVGNYLKSYPNFANFLSTDKYANAVSFLLEPEPFGKANIIYSVYKISTTKDYLVTFLLSEFNISPVFDMALVCGLFCRYTYAYIPEVLFKKRILDPNYSKKMTKPNTYPDWYFIDHDRLNDLSKAIAYSTKDTAYKETCRKVIEYRLELNQTFEQYFLEISLRDVFHIIMKRFNWYILLKKHLRNKLFS